MAFPTSGILDNFNRSNEALSTSSDWSDAYNGHEIISNEILGDTGSDANVSNYDGDTFTGAVEVYITIDRNSTTEGVAVYVLEDAGDIDGYQVSLIGSTLELYRSDAGSDTSLDSDTISFSDGDKIGISVDSGTVKGFHYSGGSWSEVLSASDSTYSGPWTLTIYSYSDNVALDDFGGGEVVAEGVTIPVFMHHYRQQGMT